MDRIALTQDGRRYVAREHFSAVIVTGLALLSAQTLGWKSAWLYGGAVLATKIMSAVVLVRINPTVLNARGVRRALSSREKVFFSVFVPTVFTVPVVAGLDVGSEAWTHRSIYELVTGLSMLVVGTSILLWALAVNAFFEPTVRIQGDRNHHVCTTGPYRFVRHPGYVGASAASAGVPLILGSMWCFVPIAITTVAFVIRTRYEDKMLRDELEGYESYAQTTPYRLLPFVW